MKSRYPGDCTLCGLPWAAGDPIGKLLGSWVHEGCKAAQVATYARIELPSNVGAIENWESRKQVARPKEGHTRGIRRVV